MEASPITLTEILVLRDYISGMRTVDIAQKHFVSLKTVEAHRQHIMLKIGVKSMNQAIAWAIRTGLIQFDIQSFTAIVDDADVQYEEP
jgi:DNA-binding CsgD family transcriptional regulator